MKIRAERERERQNKLAVSANRKVFKASQVVWKMSHLNSLQSKNGLFWLACLWMILKAKFRRCHWYNSLYCWSTFMYYFIYQEEKARKEEEEAKKKADDDARKKMILSNLTFTGYKVVFLLIAKINNNKFNLGKRHHACSIGFTLCTPLLPRRHRLDQKDKRKEKRRGRS